MRLRVLLPFTFGVIAAPGAACAASAFRADVNPYRARPDAAVAAERTIAPMPRSSVASLDTARARLPVLRGGITAIEAPSVGRRPANAIPASDGHVPRWLQIAYTLFLAILVPVWLVKNGAANFLWFSDIAMFATGAALWLESSLLASAMAVGVLLPEALWNVSFFGRLLTGRRVSGLADYMFERGKSRLTRALSLALHVVLPVVLLFSLTRLGYDERAWLAQTVLAWLVLPVTYLLTDPARNINWVFGPGGRPQRRMPPLAYLALLMAAFPVIVYLPTHILLAAAF